jgi:elongation factor P
VKVIASSLRKGNVLDDGKLYVVLNAESFHPGKGTPTTQIDMRRISDGVKTSQRYKTTEQVERAHVEEQDFTFLYQDGDGYHFMNAETYDQVTLQADMVGDQRLPGAGDEGATGGHDGLSARSRCRRRRP